MPKPTTDHLGAAWADQLAGARQAAAAIDIVAAEEQVLMHLAASADGYRGAYPMPVTAADDDGWAEARIADDAAPQDMGDAEAYIRAGHRDLGRTSANSYLADDGRLWIHGVWDAAVANFEDGTGPNPYERGVSDRLMREALDRARADEDEDGWW
jgi:hypothetical protein